MTGGLIALTVEEAERLIDWYFAKCAIARIDGEDGELAERIVEWRSRHVPVGQIDGD